MAHAALFRSKDDLLNKTLWDIGFFKDINKSKNLFLELKNKEYIRYEDLPLETKDGRSIDVEFVSNVYQVDGKKIIQCNVRDITRRKRAEQALKESEEKYKILIENSEEAIAVAQDGVLKFVNPKVVEVTGYSKGELESKPFVQLIHSDDRDKVLANYTKRLQGESISEPYAFRIVSRSSEIRWVEIKPVRISWMGKLAILSFMSDITRRKMDEDRLRLLESAVIYANDGVLVLEPDPDRQGRPKIVYVNPVFRRMTGYSDDIIGEFRKTNQSKYLYTINTIILMHEDSH